MADDQDHAVEPGAGDSAATDVVDAKPDRTSVLQALLRWVFFLVGVTRDPGSPQPAMLVPRAPTHGAGHSRAGAACCAQEAEGFVG